MAYLIYNNKEFKRVESIEVWKRNNINPSTVIRTDTGKSIELPGDMRFYLEIEGNVEYLKSTNIATVIGNVGKATVHNIAKIEGYCDEITGNLPIIDKNIRVTKGRDLIYQETANHIFMPIFHDDELNIKHWDELPITIIKVKGNLKELTYSADSYPAVLGDVKVLDVDNLLKVKGNVTEINVFNRLYYTNGPVPEVDFRELLIEKINNRIKNNRELSGWLNIMTARNSKAEGIPDEELSLD